MPYSKPKKRKCRKADGSSGSWVVDKELPSGKSEQSSCHDSENKASASIRARKANEADVPYGEEINEDIARILVKDFTKQTIKELGMSGDYRQDPDVSRAMDLGADLEQATLGTPQRKKLSPEEQAKINKKMTVTQVVFRTIGYEIAKGSGGDFIFVPPASISRKGGIRINPKDDEATAASLLEKIAEVVEGISWLEIDTSLGGGDGIIEPGLEGSPSGRFTSVAIKTVDDLMSSSAASAFKVAVFNAMIKSGVDENESNLLLFGKSTKKRPNPSTADPQPGSLLGKFSTDKLANKFYIVINSKSLSNKLFTTGITDLAEYAVAHAIDPGQPTPASPVTINDIEAFKDDNEYFKNCVDGSITKPSWAGAQDEQKLVFAKTYVSMVEKLSGHLKTVSKKYDINFGNEIEAAGGTGGAAYDVMTDTANIHVKFDESGSMSRLSGIQKESSKSTDPEEIKDAVQDALEVNASHRWQTNRNDFLSAFEGIPGVPLHNSKDAAWLAEVGYYFWLAHPHDSSKVVQWLDANNVAADHSARSFISSPPNFNIFSLIKNAVTQEFLNPGTDEETENKKQFFYITFFDAKDDVEASVGKIKIEQLGFGSEDELKEFESNIEIGMHPRYGKGQTTRPFALYTAGDNNKTFLEFEFRNSDAGKPIQVHRGANFSAEDSEEQSIARVLIKAGLIKSVVRDILGEKRFLLPENKMSLIVEELTGADKSEIKRMIAKEIDSSTTKKMARKIFLAEFDREFKKMLDSKPAKDSIRAGVESAIKDKATKKEIAEVTKAVIKKLYRELSYSSVHIVDRIKI